MISAILVWVADRVDRDQRAGQSQALQQERDGDDLVRLVADRLLAQHQALPAGPGGDEMQGLAPSYARKLVTGILGGVFDLFDPVLERYSFDEFGELI